MSQSKSQWDPKHYEDKFSFVYEYGEELLSLLDPHPGERILDLGCGTGQLTHQIAQSGAQVIGMDKSAEMIRSARKKYPDTRFEVGDASYFQFDRPFDAIFSNATLHWVLNYQSCIQSMYMNLKEQGRFIAEFGGKGNIEHIITILRNVLKRHGYEERAQLEIWYFPTIGEYAFALEAIGFHVKWALHFNRPTVLKGDLKDWLNMFAMPFLQGLTAPEIELIQNEVQKEAKDKCFVNGKWYADYKRLRIIATKQF